MTMIKELITNDEFVGFYLLKELELKQTNTSPAKDYFDLVLCDASGQRPALILFKLHQWKLRNY